MDTLFIFFKEFRANCSIFLKKMLKNPRKTKPVSFGSEFFYPQLKNEVQKL